MSLTTDPATRQAFITGLRDLADYLDQHPAVPVPTYGTDPPVPPAAPTTAAAPRSTTSPASSASPSKTHQLTPATTRPSGPSARSATGCSPSPTHAMARYHAADVLLRLRHPRPQPDTWT